MKPQAAYRSCSGAVHVTEIAGAQPLGRRLTYDQPAINSLCLLF